jgi:hypothetical protein
MRQARLPQPCYLCTKPFSPIRSDAKFCSPACRQLAHRIEHGRSQVIRSKQIAHLMRSKPATNSRKES